jgi:hypothetical protein
MRLTGLPVDRFCALLAGAMPLIAAAERQRLSRRERWRGTGAGKKHDLPLCAPLLMTLIYYRTYVAQEFFCYLSGLNASNAGRNLAQIRPVLAQLFRIPGRRIVMTPKAVTNLSLTGPDNASTVRKAA